MQQSVKPQQSSGNSQIHSIIITAITLFTLSGAILGFAVGAFTHPHPSQQTTNNPNGNKKSTQAAVSKTPTPTPTTTTTKAVQLGCPDIETGFNLDGTITITLIAKQKTGSCTAPKTETNMTSDGITCRILLTQAKDTAPEIDGTDTALFKDTTNYSGTFPHEITNGLILSSGGSLTQPCVRGQANWMLKLSPTLPKGKYYIVGLTGNTPYYNYSWSTQLEQK